MGIRTTCTCGLGIFYVEVDGKLWVQSGVFLSYDPSRASIHTCID